MFGMLLGYYTKYFNVLWVVFDDLNCCYFKSVYFCFNLKAPKVVNLFSSFETSPRNFTMNSKLWKLPAILNTIGNIFEKRPSLIFSHFTEEGKLGEAVYGECNRKCGGQRSMSYTCDPPSESRAKCYLPCSDMPEPTMERCKNRCDRMYLYTA